MVCSLANFLNFYFLSIQFTGILPHINHTGIMSIFVRIKSIFLVLIAVICFAEVLMFRFIIVHAYMDTVCIYVDSIRLIATVLSTLAYLPPIVMDIMKNPKWAKISNIIQLVKASPSKKNIIINLLVIALCSLTAIGLNIAQMYILSDKPIIILMIYVTHVQCFYYGSSNAVTISLFTLAINDKLNQMQRIFKELYKCQLGGVIEIKRAKRLYLAATEMTVLINEFFGAKILLGFGKNATRMLWLLIMSVQLWNPLKFDKRLDQVYDNLSWIEFIITIVFGILDMIPPYIITMSYARIATKLEYLLMNCYQLEDKFAHESYEHKEIESLWRFISENRLTFTAMDFFKIEPWVLLGIIASSTTYFIALIQFN